MIELRVLGSVDLRGEDGEDIPSVLCQPKRLALLVFLAVARPAAFHRRDELVGLFWPESDQQHARAALRRAVHFIRGSLGSTILLNRGAEEIGLNWEGIRCDARDFADAAERGETELATELYRGDLLPAFFLTDCPEVERWLERERLRLRELAAAAHWVGAHRRLASGRISEGERMGRKALQMAGTDEAEVRAFLSALVRAGNRAAAIRFYEGFVAGLRETLDLEPSGETQTLAMNIRQGGGG